VAYQRYASRMGYTTWLALLPKQIMEKMLVTLLVGRDLSGDSSSLLSSLIGLCPVCVVGVQCAGGGPEPVQRVVQPGQRTAQGQQGRQALDDLASLATQFSIEKVLQPPRVLLGLSHPHASVCRSMTRCRASRRRSSSTPASLPPGTGLVRHPSNAFPHPSMCLCSADADATTGGAGTCSSR
jgi:hypothetical protein